MRHSLQKKEKGAVAIEFAALFLIFFTLVYAILAYSLPLLLGIVFQQISADAGRAILKVDPAQEETTYIAKINEQIGITVDNFSFLPASWRDGNCAAPQEGNWQLLPAGSGHPSYGHWSKSDVAGETRLLVHICLQRKYNKDGPDSDRAIIPILEFFSVKIPTLPTNKQGDTVISGSTMVML
ncbi:TadE/TadG family type IV pilus assembly protein [Zobellella iuensis]|uniref:Pilus assembly protein n=1 Tax=Zobellella iuensis TaxID=2803811 RepID=A0ABS1QPV1_9GAMM|nr:TadE/TadG family type IV pilus assembly protein [Zobellella iuensis]MBL1376612.1 pilus assembly protein [Zobellella iuensis]